MMMMMALLSFHNLIKRFFSVLFCFRENEVFIVENQENWIVESNCQHQSQFSLLLHRVDKSRVFYFIAAVHSNITAARMCCRKTDDIVVLSH